MSRVESSFLSSSRLWILPVLLTVLFAACSSSTSPTNEAASPYQQAKDMFKQGNVDRVINLTGPIAASTSDPEMLNARVLRAVIFSARLNAYKELADTYQKGSQKAKNPQFIASFSRHRSDALQYGGTAVLNLGEVVMEFTSAPTFPKEVTLDVPWPSVEGPKTVPALAQIRQGEWVSEDDQTSARLDAQRKEIDDALAALLGGNRSKARVEMTAGPVKISDLDFALFLEKEFVNGLVLFGPKYQDSPDQLKTLCGVADRLAPPIETMLKESPNKAKEEEFKKLQQKIKNAEKYT